MSTTCQDGGFWNKQLMECESKLLLFITLYAVDIVGWMLALQTFLGKKTKNVFFVLFY